MELQHNRVIGVHTTDSGYTKLDMDVYSNLTVPLEEISEIENVISRTATKIELKHVLVVVMVVLIILL